MKMTFWDFVNNHWFISFIAFMSLLYGTGCVIVDILKLIQNITLIKKKRNK